MVAVYIPEYVVGHWWEHFLHNQSALRLKTRLLFIPGLMVTNVPYQLGVGSERWWRRPCGAGRGRPGGRDDVGGSAADGDGHAPVAQ